MSVLRRIRHAPGLERAEWLWRVVRPLYDRALALVARRGIVRVFNGTEPIRLDVSCRHMNTAFEPVVWHPLLAAVRPGDVVADVGAFVGVYTVALARRAARVHAFEPDPVNAATLRRHLALNGVADRVQVHEQAVGAVSGSIDLHAIGAATSTVLDRPEPPIQVPQVTLDAAFPDGLDLLKVDVEGYEDDVLRGAERLLTHARRPRAVYVELHPTVLEQRGTSLDAIRARLVAAGYRVRELGAFGINAWWVAQVP